MSTEQISPECRAVPARFPARTRAGRQLTSEAFTNALKAHGVRISMDGKGRWLDNVYVERLWRLKQEEVYRCAYETASEARKEIAGYLRYFNEDRPHQDFRQ